MPTKLENVLKECVLVANELYVAERDNKLTPEAYLEQAIKNAKTNHKEMDALQAALDHPGNITREIEQFIREIRINLIEKKDTPIPLPAERFEKLARVYGSPELAGQLAMVRHNVGTTLALAVRLATQQRPKQFGTVDDWGKLQELIWKLKDRKSTLLESMARSISSADIVFDADGAPWLAGMHVQLRKNWPPRLLEDACSRPKAMKQRVQLESKVAA